MSTSKKDQTKPLAKDHPHSQIQNNQADSQEPSPAVEKVAKTHAYRHIHEATVVY